LLNIASALEDKKMEGNQLEKRGGRKTQEDDILEEPQQKGGEVKSLRRGGLRRGMGQGVFESRGRWEGDR